MERVAGALNKVVCDLLRRAPVEEAPLIAWPFVCGSAVAKRTRALSFAAGILRVEVPDRTWRAQLCELTARYLAIMNSLTPAAVERILFVLPGEVLPEERESR